MSLRTACLGTSGTREEVRTLGSEKMAISDLLYLAISSPSAVLLVIVLLLAPYVISAARQQWIVYRTVRQLPCDPDEHWMFGHAPKVYLLGTY